MTIKLISVDSNGNLGNDDSGDGTIRSDGVGSGGLPIVLPISGNASISADGRYVLFASFASNLVLDDTNQQLDIFVRDLETNTTRLVSLASNGDLGNDASGDASISTDGRFVVFGSFANNLVTGDTNEEFDIFVRDLQTNTTRLVSLDSNGIQGNNDSGDASISADGRYVVFRSDASNLVTGDTNQDDDIFVRDLETNTTRIVSLDSNGNVGDNDSSDASISADGRYVVFRSDAGNLVTGDTNQDDDIFVRDLETNTTSFVSLDADGNLGDNDSGEPSISADGRYVVFTSFASNLVPDDDNDIQDIFVRDLQTNTTRLVSLDANGNLGNNDSFAPAISADGRYVVFSSNASNFVTDDTNNIKDVFVRDLQTNTISLISVDSNGNLANDESVAPAISADGSRVVFTSNASNLVPSDTNGKKDVFLEDFADLPSPNAAPLDIDGSGGQPSFARDSLLISAFLFFYTPERTDYGVLDKFILDRNATRTTGNEIATFAKDELSIFDVDGSGGQPSFARDSLLISAFLFFYTPERTDYGVLDKFILDRNATRTTGNEIADYLKGFIGASVAPIYADSQAITGSQDFIAAVGNDIMI